MALGLLAHMCVGKKNSFFGGLECVGHSFAYVSNFIQYFLEKFKFKFKRIICP
jgi:hypothetical protein